MLPIRQKSIMAWQTIIKPWCEPVKGMQKHSGNLVLSTRMELPAKGMNGILGYFFMSPAMTLSPSCSPGSLPRFGKDTRHCFPDFQPHQFQTRSRTSNYISRKPTRSFMASSLTKRGAAGRVGKTPRKESFMERLSQLLLLGVLILLPVKGVQAETPKDPIYIKTSNGWTGAYAHGNEYAEFRVIGNGAKLQDPYHILLQKNVGMMVSFVDQKELQDNKDVLSAHAQWETNYWHQHASRVESNNRADLIGTRKDVRVTEIKVYDDKGAQLSSYLIGLAAKDGVFALSVSSPAKKGVDPLVKELVSSFKLVPRNLDAEEAKRLSSEAKAQR